MTTKTDSEVLASTNMDQGLLAVGVCLGAITAATPFVGPPGVAAMCSAGIGLVAVGMVYRLNRRLEQITHRQRRRTSRGPVVASSSEGIRSQAGAG